MKRLIQKHLFNNLIKNGKVNPIKNDYINEFIIGKNTFYEVKNYFELINYHEKLNKILENVKLNNASVAFRKNYSYFNLFDPHKKNYNFLRLDICSFFYSINVEDIKEIFKPYVDETQYIDEKKEQSILDAFINTITYTIPEDSINKKFSGKQVLPMGFKTSPIISNIIFRKLDIQIQKLCLENNIVYTRYADDMLFSSQKYSKFVHSDIFIERIKVILYQLKFKLNNHKTIKAKHTLSLNGYIIQYSKYEKASIFSTENKINEIRLSNKKIHIIKKLIHHLERGDNSWDILKKLFRFKIKYEIFPAHTSLKVYYDKQLIRIVIGYRAYLLSIIKFNKRYKCTTNETIKNYSYLIDKLDSFISEE
ncbi:reverse transcriptase domain-containing protein [Malaciobacter canalis]|uniref:reverse transcriptase domain-containing protein n=1 Tax=Malaciobacter canalis TaxID=1912871 RepID=UPI00384DFF71